MAKRTRRRITPYAEQAKLYRWFVVEDGRVTSGWEFREDAQDAADEVIGVLGVGAKVVAKSRLARLGLQPEDATRGLTAHNFKIPKGR